MTVVLWVAVALILYSYAGYPLLLLLRAALQRRTDRDRRPFEPTVTMLIVAHNEESVIEAKLKNCLSLDYPKDRLEVLVASDGSSDRTEAIVAGFADRGVRLLSLPGPRGKPAALNRAVAEGHGEILVLCDARQTLAQDSIRELVQHFADPRVGAVSGELHLGEADGAGRGVDLYWKYEKLIRRTESQIDSTVGVTGALYALRKELFRPLDPRIILDDVAIPMDVVQAGRRVLFEPGARVFDRASNASDTEYRRKLRTLAGNYQLVFLEPWLLDPRRNRLWWQFVSHKLTRLAVPWCLLAAFGASLALAESGWFYQHLFLLQAAFYLLAVAGWLLDSYHAAPRWLAFPYAFLLLNLAAASSLFGFLLGTQKAAWKEVAP